MPVEVVVELQSCEAPRLSPSIAGSPLYVVGRTTLHPQSPLRGSIREVMATGAAHEATSAPLRHSGEAAEAHPAPMSSFSEWVSPPLSYLCLPLFVTNGG
jgi:hypothetical protein